MDLDENGRWPLAVELNRWKENGESQDEGSGKGEGQGQGEGQGTPTTHDLDQTGRWPLAGKRAKAKAKAKAKAPAQPTTHNPQPTTNQVWTTP